MIAADISSCTPDADREQLWAKRLGDTEFEICCIPFILFDVALGDVVQTSSDYWFQRVLKPSGRFVFRAWFGDSYFPRDEIVKELQQLGAVGRPSMINIARWLGRPSA
jgi:hypothetical protein